MVYIPTKWFTERLFRNQEPGKVGRPPSDGPRPPRKSITSVRYETSKMNKVKDYGFSFAEAFAIGIETILFYIQERERIEEEVESELEEMIEKAEAEKAEALREAEEEGGL